MNRPATSPPQGDNVPITMIPRPSATCKCAPSHRVYDEFPRTVVCGGARAHPLTDVVIYDNIAGSENESENEVVNSSRQSTVRKTRPVSWIRAALKEFEKFPEGAKSICLTALTIAAEGGMSDIAKPMHGLGSGVFEIALPFRGDAFRVIYAVQLAEEIWVVHAFQKKSTQGIKTPKREIDLIKDRLKRLREMLR